MLSERTNRLVVVFGLCVLIRLYSVQNLILPLIYCSVNFRLGNEAVGGDNEDEHYKMYGIQILLFIKFGLQICLCFEGKFEYFALI